LSEIKYNITRKFNLKNTYIEIKADASVEVKTNLTTSAKSISDFIDRKSGWILKKQLLLQNIKTIKSSQLYLFGEIVEKEHFGISSQNELDAFYREKAIKTIKPLVTSWSEQMHLIPTCIGYRKNRTRWGSCSGKDRLSFNTLLARTPLEFIEYVVVHELCHIKHKNHSRTFWRLVKEYLPDYKNRQNLVKYQSYLKNID